jgi:hypothetical protein
LFLSNYFYWEQNIKISNNKLNFKYWCFCFLYVLCLFVFFCPSVFLLNSSQMLLQRKQNNIIGCIFSHHKWMIILAFSFVSKTITTICIILSNTMIYLVAWNTYCRLKTTSFCNRKLAIRFNWYITKRYSYPMYWINVK